MTPLSTDPETLKAIRKMIKDATEREVEKQLKDFAFIANQVRDIHSAIVGSQFHPKGLQDKVDDMWKVYELEQGTAHHKRVDQMWGSFSFFKKAIAVIAFLSTGQFVAIIVAIKELFFK